MGRTKRKLEQHLLLENALKKHLSEGTVYGIHIVDMWDSSTKLLRAVTLQRLSNVRIAVSGRIHIMSERVWQKKHFDCHFESLSYHGIYTYQQFNKSHTHTSVIVAALQNTQQAISRGHFFKQCKCWQHNLFSSDCHAAND